MLTASGVKDAHCFWFACSECELPLSTISCLVKMRHLNPQSLLFTSVFPLLAEQLACSDILVILLPTLLSIVQASSEHEYKQLIRPQMRHIYSQPRPVQVRERVYVATAARHATHKYAYKCKRLCCKCIKIASHYYITCTYIWAGSMCFN